MILEPNRLIAFQGHHTFKDIVKQKSNKGPGQIRRARRSANKVTFQYTFDAWECTSSSSKADHMFRERRGLAEKIPMPVGASDMPVGVHEHGVGRHDIESCKAQNAAGIIERHAMARPPAAIVTNDVKSLVSKLAHDFALVPRHRPERIVRMIGFARRL